MASNQLSKNIARCRKQIGMTQEDLGQALFVSGQAVSRWERGGTPDAELLPKIADALGVSLDVLFGREADRESDAETALSRELARTPAAKRVERAEQLAWHMMKIVASSADKNFSYIPDCSDLDIPDNADYVYICENETINGTTWNK